jgi:hypothetical protein
MKHAILMYLENEHLQAPDDEHMKCTHCGAVMKKISHPHHKRTKKCLEIQKFKHELMKFVAEQIIGK